MSKTLATERLTLRSLTPKDLPDFLGLMTNPQSMVDYGRPDSADQAEAKFRRYLICQARHGISRLHVSDADGFLGYVGVFVHDNHTPLGPHAEIGWRLLPRAWGSGYATEAARAALTDAFATTDLAEVLAYTAPDNLRSQAVMERLALTREPQRDFQLVDSDIGVWSCLVWLAHRRDWINHDALGGME